jgi:uncharacterized protein involved in outer membrane biogenesis
MRRLLRVLLIVAAVVGVLLVGLLIAARVYLRSESARRQVAAHLEALYGGPVEVDEADVGVLGDSTLRGLRLYEPGKADQTPWASVGSVKTDVSALDLVRGVAPKQITLGDPAITLRLDKNGRLLTDLPQTGKTEGSLPEVRVEGGQVTVRQEGRPEMVVKGVSADVRRDGGLLAVTGAIADPEWGDWSLDGSIDRAAGSLTATLKADRADVTQEKLLKLPVVPPAVWREVKAQGATSVEFTFRHDPRDKRANHYRVVLHPDGAAITVPALALDAKDVHGGITVEDELVTLAKAAGRAIGGELGVDGALDFRGKEDVYRVTVTARGLDVAQVPEAWGLDERLRRLGGKLNGKAELTIRYDGEVHTSGEGTGQIVGVMLGGQPTTIDLHLHPTRKGFNLGQGPAAQRRLPASGPVVGWVERCETHRADGCSGGSRSSTHPTLLAALIMLQAPAEPEPSLTRDATRAIDGATKALGGAILDTGRKAVGSLPKGDITKPAPAPQPPTYLDITLNLKDVDLARLVKDLQIKVPFEVSGRLTMKVQASLPVDQARDLKLYKVSGTATLPTFSLSGVDMKDVTAKVRYDNGVLRLDELRGQLVGGPAPKEGKPGAGTFDGTARLGLIPEGDFTADLKLTEIPLAQVLRAAGIKEETGGALSGSAHLRAPAGKLSDLASWEGTAEVSAPSIVAYGLALTDAGASARLDKGLLTLRDMTGKLEGAPVTGSGEAKLVFPYTYKGQLELAKGDLASLQRLAPSVRPPVAVAGRFGISAEVNGRLVPFSAKVSGTGTGEDVKVEKVSVSGLNFHWSASGDVLKLTDVKARLYGGDVTGSADVPLSAKQEGKVNLKIDDVDVGGLVKDVPAVPLRLEGKVSGTVKGTLPAAASGERSFDADIDLTAPKLRVQNLPTEKLTGTVSYHKGVGEYHLKGGLLGGTFELDGRIPPRPAGGAAPPTKPAPLRRQAQPAAPPPDSHLRIRGAQLGRLGEALGTRGALDQLHGRVDLDVDFRLEPPDYYPVGTGAVTITRLRWGDQEIADSLRGDIVLADGEARVRNLNAAIGGGSLRGQIVLRLRDLDRSHLTLAIDGADPAKLLAPWPSLAANVSGSADARLRATVGRHWTGGGDVVLTRGKVYGVEVSEWRIPLRFDMVPARDRFEVTVEDMSAQVAHGRVSGRGTFGFGSGTRVDGSLRFYGVDLRALLRPLTDSTTLGGGTASGRVQFSGSNVHSLDDITADVDASFAQAQAFQLPIVSALVPFIAPGQSSSTFQSGDLRGRLSGGILRVQRLTLSGNAVNLFAQGNVTTAGRLNLDVTATTRVIGASSGLLRLLGLRLPAFGPIPLTLLVEATSYFSSSSVHLLVTGTIRSPVVRVEPLTLLTEEAARFLLLRAAGPLP